jgi:hypothetical protein
MTFLSRLASIPEAADSVRRLYRVNRGDELPSALPRPSDSARIELSIASDWQMLAGQPVNQQHIPSPKSLVRLISTGKRRRDKGRSGASSGSRARDLSRGGDFPVPIQSSAYSAESQFRRGIETDQPAHQHRLLGNSGAP